MAPRLNLEGKEDWSVQSGDGRGGMIRSDQTWRVHESIVLLIYQNRHSDIGHAIMKNMVRYLPRLHQLSSLWALAPLSLPEESFSDFHVQAFMPLPEEIAHKFDTKRLLWAPHINTWVLSINIKDCRSGRSGLHTLSKLPIKRFEMKKHLESYIVFLLTVFGLQRPISFWIWILMGTAVLLGRFLIWLSLFVEE